MSQVFMMRLNAFAAQPKWDINIDLAQDTHLVTASQVEGDRLVHVIGYLAPGQQVDYFGDDLPWQANVCITRRYTLTGNKIILIEKAKDEPIELITLGKLCEWAGVPQDEIALMNPISPQLPPKKDPWEETVESKQAVALRNGILDLLEKHSLAEITVYCTEGKPFINTVRSILGGLDPDLGLLSDDLFKLFDEAGPYASKVTANLRTEVNVEIVKGEGTFAEPTFRLPSFV